MTEFDYDLFISHASEDKAAFVRPLVGMLEQHGLRVWFDEAELQVGDSLIESVEDGLRRSRFGVVVLSPSFFAKRWPRAELDALASRELSTGDRVVLPIWVDVDEEEVRSYSPLLANKVALRADTGVDMIAKALEARVRDDPIPSPVAASEGRLDALLLRGRIYPHAYSPVITTDARALVSRVALAARVPTEPEPTFGSATQQRFEDALASSSLESFLLELTMRVPGIDPEHFWRLVEPTKSWIVTGARPAATMIVKGWTVEARGGISLKHQPTVAPLGWLILHLDVAIRPLEDPGRLADEESEWMPLGLDDLFALLYVQFTALLDEIGPAVLPDITGNDNALLAVGCVALPRGDPFSRYVRFSSYATGRAEGATDASGVEWYAHSLSELSTREERATAIREQINVLFTDGGYRGYEEAVERLGPPHLPPPPVT